MTRHDTASGEQVETVPNGTATNGQSEKTERNDETERRNVEQNAGRDGTTRHDKTSGEQDETAPHGNHHPRTSRKKRHE